MNRVQENDEDTRILVLAPRGRDAAVIADVLGSHAMEVCTCPTMADLLRELGAGAGLAFLTEEALAESSTEPLAAWVAGQPPWSDFPFIVLTSNVFAVLGLRAMFFMLEGAAARFHLLSYGLAATLLFIGAKMLLAGVWKIPIGIALAMVALLIGASMVASLWSPPKQREGATRV